jgi:hypothetical protein
LTVTSMICFGILFLLGEGVWANCMWAQDPLKLPGKNYAVAFENKDVTVIRAHYGPHEKIPVHDHDAFATVFVYLSDSGAVRIDHVDEGGKVVPVTRPPTVKGAFRIAPGVAEKHSIENLGALPSDFLRVELKRVPLKLDEPFRGKAPASLVASADTVEFDQQGVKVERIVCVGAEACQVKAADGGSLVVAITPFGLMQGGARREELVKAGDVKWVSGEGITVKAEEGGAAHLLRIVMAGAK